MSEREGKHYRIHFGAATEEEKCAREAYERNIEQHYMLYVFMLCDMLT